MKNSRKKTIFTILALFLIIAVAVVGSVTAYWTAGLTSIPQREEQVEVTVGKAKELEAVFDVTVEKKLGNGSDEFTANHKLVPAGRGTLSFTDGSNQPAEKLVIIAKVKIRGTNYTEHITGSDLQKIKATLSFKSTGLAQDKFNITGDLVQIKENVEINNPTLYEYRWELVLKEPGNKTEYEAVINKKVDLNIKLEKVA